MGAVLPLPTPTPSTSITLLLPPSELSGVLSLVMTRLLMLVLKGGTHGLAGRDMEHQTPPATSHHTGVAWQQQFDPLHNTTQHNTITHKMLSVLATGSRLSNVWGWTS